MTAPIKLRKLHSQQALVFRARRRYRYRVVACGRRWGKTILGCTELVTSAGEKPGVYWYIAPTMKAARDIAWRSLLSMVPRSWLKRSPNESRLEIEFLSGAVIALKGADDPDSLRGRGLSGVVIDEYADVKFTLWDEVLQPSLADRQGWALFLGTPKGFDHFYTMFQQGQDPTFEHWASWQFKTSESPTLTPEELTDIRKQYEQRGQLRLFKQEFEASFDSNAGYILGALWKPSHTVSADDVALLAGGLEVGEVIPWHVLNNPHWVPPKTANVFGSVDYGFGAPWSAHLHAALPGGHTRSFHEWYAREVQDYEQARRIRQGIEALEARGMPRPEWIVMDPAMWASRKESGLAKSIAEVYEDELGRPLNIQLIPGAAGRPARLSRPQRWMAALDTAGDGLPWHSVTTACPALIRTVPRVPWDKDDPEVEDDDSDNHCIAAGSLIATSRGEVPIEHVRSGDHVLTRRGYRRVLKAWSRGVRPTLVARTIDGDIAGTPDHDVLTPRGWMRFDELDASHIVYDVSLWRTLRPSSRPAFKNGAVCATTAATLAAAATSDRTGACSIDRSGRTWKARFLTACTSIISTATRRTTPAIISPSFLPPRTWASTAPTRLSNSAEPDARTPPSPVPLGWRCRQRIAVSVAGVGLCLQNAGPANGSSARHGAGVGPRTRRGMSVSILSERLRATGAVWCFALAAWVSGSVATRRVITVQPSGAAVTYDLSVEHDHEFFANGLLVSNCYEDGGRFFEARPHIPKALVSDPLATLDPLSRRHHQAREKSRQKPSGLNVQNFRMG